MTVETYLTKAADLGLNRGRLAGEFPPETGTVAAFRGEQIDWHKSEKIVPPPIREDLSRFVMKPRLHQLRDLLAKRGETVESLAAKLGWQPITMRGMLSCPNHGRPSQRERVAALLTPEEREIFER